MNLTVGTVLQGGKYILNQILVQDGLSVTFKATQTHLNKAIALKTIRPNSQGLMDQAQLKQQFVQDARCFAKCQHPGLASILDFFEEAGLPFVVMDYVAGQSLAERVRFRGPLSEVQALHYIRQVGSALSLVHEHGLIHGSVKPEAMIQPADADFVVLVDYGTAHSAMPMLTQAQTASLQGEYRAIEQYQTQERVTAAADVYGLAASIYFLVTGQPPTAATLRHQVPLVSPRQLRPQLSPAIEAAILNGMAMQAQARAQTIADWLTLLPNAQSSGMSQNGSVPPSGLTQAAVQSNGHNGHASTLPHSVLIHSTQVASLPAARASSPTKPGGFMPKLVIAASILAALAGVGSGLALRVNGATGPGSTFFHTEQSFPPADHWPGSEPIAEPTAPTVSEPPAVSSEAAPEPVIPRSEPLYTRPEPAPVKEPEPVETAPPTDTAPPLAPTPDLAEPPPAVAPSPIAPPEPPSNLAPEPAPPASVAPPPAPIQKPENGM